MTITDAKQFTPDEANPEAARAAFFTAQITEMAKAFEKITHEREQHENGDPRFIIADCSSIIRRGAREINTGLITGLSWSPEQRVEVDGRIYWMQPSQYAQHGPSMAVQLEAGDQVYFGIDGAPEEGMRSARIEDQMLLAADALQLLDAKTT